MLGNKAENLSRISMMPSQMIELMLNVVIDDVDLRKQMIDLMLQHKDFMNSIRHGNFTQEH